MTSRSFGHYIFIDESGSLTQSTDWHMVVCAVVTTDRRKLNQIVRDARRKNRSSPVTRGWLHAVDDDPATVEFLLRQAVKVGDIWFASSVLDKRYYLDRHEHPNEVYQKFVAFTIQRALETLKIPAVDSYIILERSFTKAALNRDLQWRIANSIGIHTSQVHVARKDDVEWGSGLQLADYLAWGLFQKYERQEARYASIVQGLMANEDQVGFAAGRIRWVDSFWK